MKMNDAEIAFATANTPLYLLRKLRSSLTVEKIAAAKASYQIYRSLRAALKRTPDTFRESVLPYVLLMALSIKSDSRKYLIEASSLSSPHHPWFKYCCEYLVSGSRTTTTQTLGFRGSAKIERPAKAGGRTNTLRLASGA